MNTICDQFNKAWFKDMALTQIPFQLKATSKSQAPSQNKTPQNDWWFYCQHSKLKDFLGYYEKNKALTKTPSIFYFKSKCRWQYCDRSCKYMYTQTDISFYLKYWNIYANTICKLHAI